MSRPILEVIALDADDARAAQAGGADRLELVSAIEEDGLTPAPATVTDVLASVDIPVRVMVRSANSFRLESEREVDELCSRARSLRAEGAREFVFGYLDESGLPDTSTLSALDESVTGCPWTFHRAIDRSADRDVLRKRLAVFAESHGLDGFLTAGSVHGVEDGLPLLRAEAARTSMAEPGYVPRLIVGGGLRLDHVTELLAAGVDAFHIGGAARSGGWTDAVDPARVAVWRRLLDDGPEPGAVAE